MSSPYNVPPHQQPPPLDQRYSFRPPRWRTRGIGFGVLLILIGAAALLENLGLLWWWRWDVFWPAVLIAVGVLIIVRRSRWP